MTPRLRVHHVGQNQGPPNLRVLSLPARASMLATLMAVSIAAGSANAQQPSACSPTNVAAEATIRQRLAEWVAATNRGDRVTAQDIWAPGMVGWFPSAAVFGDSAAYAAAGIAYDRAAGIGTVSYEIRVEEVAASEPIAAVHDLWTETR